MEQVETPKDAEQAGVASRWLREIELASAHEKDWRARGQKIVDRYRDEDRNGDSESQPSRFNVLFANTEVLKGVIYQKTPVPDARRRFLDKDPIGRQAAQILQRALSYSVDAYDFDDVMEAVAQDMLLPGRGVPRVRYVPTVSEQQTVYHEVKCEPVEWDMLRISPAKSWRKVRWVAFGELFTRDELVRAFGDKGRKCVLDWKPKDKDEDKDQLFARALVWQIWDKRSRKVISVSKGLPDEPLAEIDDPLALEGFFPIPKPAYSICSTTSLIPVPEFVQYQDQAIELDRITERIDRLVEQLKFRGIRDATMPELENLASADDGDFIAVENLSNLLEKGGLEKLLMTASVEAIAKVLIGLYDQRERVLAIIYQITGLSDIIRGASKASETATAQEIKGRYANVRIGPRQKAIAKVARDVFRMKAEIIAEKYDADTLKLMTGPDLWFVTQEAQDPRTGQVVKQRVDATEQIMTVLRNDKLRGFKVDIETDSTVQPDASEEQRNRVELVTAVSSFLEKAIPAVASGQLPKEFAIELLSFGVRGFKLSPQIEEAIDGLRDSGGQGQPQQQANPAQDAQTQAQMAIAAAQAQEAQEKAREAKAKADKAVFDAQLKQRELAMPAQPEVVQ